jgi:hypothetical protein
MLSDCPNMVVWLLNGKAGFKLQFSLARYFSPKLHFINQYVEIYQLAHDYVYPLCSHQVLGTYYTLDI